MQLGNNGKMEQMTLEEKVEYLGQKTHELVMGLNAVIATMGVSIEQKADGRVQWTIPPLKEGVGLLARLYHEVTHLKNMVKKSPLVNANGMPLIS